jgi:N-hydroxyarylamine O-acetyltransferase
MDLDAYLRRIRYDGPLTIDERTLAGLQRAHLLAVPFENLSIHWGEAIVLDVAKHYAKIVERGRGGFCYEQNTLFAWALKTIGFDVSLLSAAVWSDRDGVLGYGDSSSHVLLRVDLEKPWIADVAFGENYRSPLPLIDGYLRQDDSRTYRLEREDLAGEETWALSSRDAQGMWLPTYRFANSARAESHFAAMCHFHQTSPLSPFTRKRLCSLATPDGRFTLSGDEWIVANVVEGTRHERPIAGEEEAIDLLRRYFGIETPAHMITATTTN